MPKSLDELREELRRSGPSEAERVRTNLDRMKQARQKSNRDRMFEVVLRMATIEGGDWRRPRFEDGSGDVEVTLKFGKYKGKTLRQIRRLDPQYLDWLLEKFGNVDDFADIMKVVRDVRSGL